MTGPRPIYCKCADPGCGQCCGGRKPHSPGRPTRVYRVDMDDTTGSLFCSGCAQDALDCGMFSSQPPGKRKKNDWSMAPDEGAASFLRTLTGGLT